MIDVGGTIDQFGTRERRGGGAGCSFALFPDFANCVLDSVGVGKFHWHFILGIRQE